MSETERNEPCCLVDDDDDFLFQHRLHLETAGFNVLVAHGQKEAEAILAQQRPDLAVIDVMMENPDAGFTLCHRIRKQDASIPVILVTSVNSETGLDFALATDEQRAWIKADALLVQADPLRAAPARDRPRLQPAQRRRYRHNMDTLKVLVTDDEMGMRLGVTRTLRDFSVRVPDVNGSVAFSVDQAESGEEALEKIDRSPPDILLLDHKMPGISGLEVLDRLAGRETDMLTIMITAYASIETAVAATKRGAYDFLAKPFTPDELKSTIRKAAAPADPGQAGPAACRGEAPRPLRVHPRAGPRAEGPLERRGRLPRHHPGAPTGRRPGRLRRTGRPQPGAHGRHAEADRRPLGPDADRIGREAAASWRRSIWPRPPHRPSRPSPPRPPPARSPSRLQAAGPLVIAADAREIEIIFNNLLTNAIKYNRDGGRVDVAVRRRNGQAVIAVSDTGIGMTEEEAERLFGEFVRIRNEKTRNILGSGLGLSIVKKLALLYGGDVSVASRPDAGSTFTVSLEAKEPAAEGAVSKS